MRCPLRSRIVPVVLGAWLAACAGPALSRQGAEAWTREAATPGDFRADRMACLEQATQEIPILQSRQPVPSYDVNESLYRECMEGRGWLPRP